MTTYSTAILTDLQTIITAGPSTTSQANAIAATGPIIDLLGSLLLLQTRFNEDVVLMQRIYNVLDSAGPDAIRASLLTLRNTFTASAPSF
jgi:hypothetical protein